MSKEKNTKPKPLAKKTFVFDEETLNYTVRLRKFNKLWLLLLLLFLPFLLLIKIDKTVNVKVISEQGLAISDCNVTFEYTAFYIYNDGRFFPENNYAKTVPTNSKGVSQFDNLEYSLYSLLFHPFTQAYVDAETTACFSDNDFKPLFHRLYSVDTIGITVSRRRVALDFKVVDEEDKQVLPGAVVKIDYNFEGQNYIDTLVTDASGMLVFEDIPKCAHLNSVSAHLDGYHDDKLLNNNLEQILQHIDDRTLYLKPKKQRVEFFVTNCNNGEPLPGAVATIILSNQSKNKTQKATTNVNGKGKATYSNAHELACIEIHVKKTFFKEGKLPRKYRVRDFVNLPDSLRTICLEPEENDIVFLNIDSVAQVPLPGVSNEISIHRQGDVFTNTVLSNKNGNFTIAGLKVGDKLSIVSTLNPNYFVNDYSIQQKEVEVILQGTLTADPKDRIIPLRPKEANLKFRVLDEYSKLVLKNVELEVYIDGKKQSTPTHTVSGEFEIKANYASTISIAASKQGYETNNTKVNTKSASYLMLSSQDARDIYLSLPPCSPAEVDFTSDAISLTKTLEFDMKQQRGSFVFEYNTYSAEDEITIYDGRADDIANSKLIFHYPMGGTHGVKRAEVHFSNRFVTILGKASKSGSDFRFKLNCPD